MTMTSKKIARRVRGKLAIAVIVGLVAGVALPAGEAAAQSARDLVGSWAVVSLDNVLADGKRVPIYGPHVQGLLVIGADGRYAVLVTRPDLAKHASNDRMASTPEENKASWQGSLAHVGKYTVNEAERTIIFHIEYSTFPNWNGIEQKRPFTLTGDELKFANPLAATSGGTAETILKRAK